MATQKEILPKDIWNKKKREMAKAYIRREVAKMSLDQHIWVHLMSLYYKSEDVNV